MLGFGTSIPQVVSRRRRGGAANPLLILDTYSAGAAYSTRKLRTAYAGSAIRVRRSSDNVEQDIGFSGNALDATALTSFIGANSGFVVTWYDQSGNGRNLTQATVARQPRIVNAGTLETINSQPAVRFDGTDDILSNSLPFLYAAGAMTAFFVHNIPATANATIVAETVSSALNPLYQMRTSTAQFCMTARNDAGTGFYAAASNIFASAFDGTANVLVARDSGALIEGFENGVFGNSVAYTRSGTFTPNTFSLMGIVIGNSTTGGPQGSISEAIFFTSALSNADFNAVGANQGTAFGITVNPF